MADKEILSREEWQQVVESRLGHKNFDVLHYTVNRITTTGGFLGHHFIVDVTIRLHGDNNSEVLHFFLKAQPNLGGSQSEWIETMHAFHKEGNTLHKVFSKIRSVLNENGKNMTWACECYYTRPDAIVLEDLSKQEFRCFSRRNILQFEHFELTIKALANMHSASIIFEEKQNIQPFCLLDVYPDVLKETFFVNVPNHPGHECMDCSVKALWYIVELIHGKEKLEKMKIELEKFMLSTYELQKPSQRFRNVLCQGDLKTENIMFRHEGEKPVEVRIVDYQFTRYAPPANDVMSFLYISSNKEFRRLNAARLLNIYYNHFAKNLSEHGLNPNEILSREEFEVSCDYYKKLGIIMANVYAPGSLVLGENIKHVIASQEDFDRFFMIDRTPEIRYSFDNDEFYRKNMVEIVEEYIDECFITS